jgi:hypothetical protein
LQKIILCALFVFVIFSGLASITPFQAHGDGFSNENVYASVGNRNLVMYIQIYPPILTSENSDDRYLHLRFYDANTNESINNVSFFLNATKGDQRLMYDLFYTKDGSITLKFLPGGKDGQWTVQGDNEPTLGGWYSQDGTVNVISPILTVGGLYHFNMTLLSFDFPNEISPSNVNVQFNSYLSVGDFYNTSIDYNSIPYNTTIISYYDKTFNSNFDPSKLQISWSMPFDWDPKKYQNRPFLVHEELRVPNSFREFVNTPTFSAMVNGNPISHSKIVLDNLSLKNTTIVHLFVYKEDVQKMANEIKPNTKTMDFVVYPYHANVTTSDDIFTDFGGLEVKLGWSPITLAPYSTNNLNLIFFDQLTGQQVINDVKYDLKILDANGGVIIFKTDLMATGGTDVQSLNLPGNGVYSVQIIVKSVVTNGIQDTTKSGTARGDLVIPSVVSLETIPEFPITTSMIFVIGVIIMMYFSRTR